MIYSRAGPSRAGPEFSDDLDWVLAASGRAKSGDARLPLIG